MQINFSALGLALKSLEDALTPPPRNDRERDGAIQRFEYTFELAWKTAQKVLAQNGIVSNSPKSVIRDLAQQRWIPSAEQWLGFLKARNATTHTYRSITADTVFESAKDFAKECKNLLVALQSK